MTQRAVCLLLLVLVSMTIPCHGSKVVFTATPANISVGVTPTLTIHCALEDETSSNNNVVQVTSIIISRVEESTHRHVASIVSVGAAVAGCWAAGASVTGDLSKTVGHLRATWSSPQQLQAGHYNCEIVALEKDETNIKFKSNVQVASTGQSVESLAESIAQSNDAIEALKTAVGACQRETDELKKTVGAGQRETDDLKKTVEACKRETDDLKQSVGAGQRETDDLKKTVGAGQRETGDLKKTVNDLKANISSLSSVHNEEGSVWCRNSVSWGENKQLVTEVRFSTPYARNPLVIISTVNLDVDKLYNFRYWIEIKDVTPTGFKVVCGTWADTVLYQIGVRWISSVA